MTLAEIIEEGRELERAMRADVPWEIWSKASRAREQFFIEHGPRLLAVAAAAVEMREADMAYGDNPTRETLLRRVSANIAFDAAGRGEKP